VPRLYPLEYDKHPAVPVCIFGPTGHGKSVYIDALLTHLETRIRWPRFSCQWMDQAGMQASRQRLRQIREFGMLPDATTHQVFPHPQVIRLRNVPQVGGCQLIFYDSGGETFNHVSNLTDAGRYLRYAPAVVWLISLTQLEYPEQLSDLMTTYAEAIVTMGGSPKDQTVIVALTKGDLLRDHESLPQSAKDFLDNDNLDPAGGAWIRLTELSKDLEGWLCDFGHANIVSLLNDQFKAARFCILSAQGAAADEENRLALEILPRGVLSPLFWLWHETLPIITVESKGQKTPFFTLTHAIEAAPAGATIQLEPKSYLLPKKLEITKPLRIRGKDPATTIIDCADERFVLGIGPTMGGVEISNVTIQHHGREAADVIRVVRGEVLLDNCFVTGAVAAPPNIPGDGVLVIKNAAAKLQGCFVYANQGNGVSLREQGKVVLRKSSLIQNGDCGLFASALSAEAHYCILTDNGRHGAYVGGSTHGRLTNNKCNNNKGNGVTAFAEAKIELRANICNTNLSHGIECRDRSEVAADGNVCSHNKNCGIFIRDLVTGQFNNTTCHENKIHGILLEDQVTPTISLNKCLANGKAGIAYSGAAAGMCQENFCEANLGDGFQVNDTAAPALHGNVAHDNGRYGFKVEPAGVAGLGPKNMAKGNTKADTSPPNLFRKTWFG
jgi:hypothetical protein